MQWSTTHTPLLLAWGSATQVATAPGRLQTAPQAPQLLGSPASLAALTSSVLPLQSLSRPSQISTPLLETTHGPSPRTNTRSGTDVRSAVGVWSTSPPSRSVLPPSSL